MNFLDLLTLSILFCTINAAPAPSKGINYIEVDASDQSSHPLVLHWLSQDFDYDAPDNFGTSGFDENYRFRFFDNEINTFASPNLRYHADWKDIGLGISLGAVRVHYERTEPDPYRPNYSVYLDDTKTTGVFRFSGADYDVEHFMINLIGDFPGDVVHFVASADSRNKILYTLAKLRDGSQYGSISKNGVTIFVGLRGNTRQYIRDTSNRSFIELSNARAGFYDPNKIAETDEFTNLANSAKKQWVGKMNRIDVYTKGSNLVKFSESSG